MDQYVLGAAQFLSRFAENSLGGSAGCHAGNKPVTFPCLKEGTHKANPILLYSLGTGTTAVSCAGEEQRRNFQLQGCTPNTPALN